MAGFQKVVNRLQSNSNGSRPPGFRRNLHLLGGSPPRGIQPKMKPPHEEWAIYTLADAFAPREPPIEVIQGLYSLPSLTCLYGPPGSLKTLLLMDMLICIAAGFPWLASYSDEEEEEPGDGYPVIQKPVLYVDFQNGQHRTEERIAALARGHGLSEDMPGVNYVSMPSPWLDASKPGGLDALKRAMDACEAQVVGIDNLVLIKGEVDENSFRMAMVMSALRLLTEEYEAALQVLHHERKDQSGRAGSRIRGHSSIEAEFDLALNADRKEGSDQINLLATKVRDAPVSPFGALWAYTHEPGTTQLYSARFYGVETEGFGSDDDIQQCIQGLLSDRELKQGDVVRQVKVSFPRVGEKRIIAMIERMVASSALLQRTGARNAKLLRVPPAA